MTHLPVLSITYYRILLNYSFEVYELIKAARAAVLLIIAHVGLDVHQLLRRLYAQCIARPGVGPPPCRPIALGCCSGDMR